MYSPLRASLAHGRLSSTGTGTCTEPVGIDAFAEDWFRVDSKEALLLLPSTAVAVVLGTGTTTAQRVQLLHTASDVRVHGLDSHVPLSSKDLHTVQGVQTRSSNSVHGFDSQKPGAHAVQFLHTLSMVRGSISSL